MWAVATDPSSLLFHRAEVFTQKLKSILDIEYSNGEDLETTLGTYTSGDKLGDGITQSTLDTSAESIPRGCRKNFKLVWNLKIDEAMIRRETAQKALEDDDKMDFNKHCTLVLKTKTMNSAKRNTWATSTGNLNLTQGGAMA